MPYKKSKITISNAKAVAMDTASPPATVATVQQAAPATLSATPITTKTW